MMLPLYNQAQDSFERLTKEKVNLNLGLYYQKFCNEWGWDRNSSITLDKQGFLSNIVNKNTKLKTDSDGILKERIERMAFLTHALGGEFRIYELRERLITGIGLDHPVEVGFLWDHIIGVPYIAGSSIKGLVRDWAENWANEKEEINKIFGSRSDNDDNQVGSVLFLDCLPYEKIDLEVDIMTPHYTSYYSGGEPPGDWNKPTPISFLTVAKSQKFIFFVAPRIKEDRKDCAMVLEWLDGALINLGAGAKTATGYGCFELAEDATRAYHERLESKIQERKKQNQLVNMSPIRREMEEDGYSVDGMIFMEKLTVKWLKRLRTEGEDSLKKEIAKHLAHWYKTNRPRDWERPRGKNIDKINLIRTYLD
jgi:CRISPR-associated protein Cmr6